LAEPAGERAISDYRIICVVRRADGHIRAVGYSQDGNSVMYDDLWTLEQARHAIQQGHRLYAVSPSTGVEVEIELHGEGIRLKPAESTDHDLDDLPTCG
jgi:hypothetical protein